MTEGKQTGEHEERIERIVRDVLSRLGRTHGSIEEATTDGTDNPDGKRKCERQQTPRVLTGRVITVEVLQGKLEGIGEVCIDPGAVVTPAARDVLRHVAVRVVREGWSESNTRQEAGRLIVGLADCAAAPVAVTRLREVHRGDIQHVARMGLLEVVHEVTEQVVLDGKKGLLFTERSAAAICLANRRRGVRAVTGRCTEDVETDVASVAANVLVIRPTGLTSWQQLQMTRAFLACRAACPIEIDADLR